MFLAHFLIMYYCLVCSSELHILQLFQGKKEHLGLVDVSVDSTVSNAIFVSPANGTEFPFAEPTSLPNNMNTNL